MFLVILFLVASVLHLLALFRIRRAWRIVKGTSLVHAATWLVVIEVCWIASAQLSAISPTRHVLLGQVWYWMGVLAICPGIAVLGARRPTTKVWGLFVVLPLIAVLGWAPLTDLFRNAETGVLSIQTPAAIGILVALLMSTGNYLGTQFGAVSLFYALGICLTLGPSIEFAAVPGEWDGVFRALGAVVTASAIHRGVSLATAPQSEIDPFERIWHDFRDLFGLVWSIRIQESMNAFAEQRQLNWRIGTDSIYWGEDEKASRTPEAEASLEESFRWHLRRFVDSDWIDLRIGKRPEMSDERTSP